MLRYCVAASTGRVQAAPSFADRTSFSKVIPERCQGASIAGHVFNQRLFWTARNAGKDLPENAVTPDDVLPREYLDLSSKYPGSVCAGPIFDKGHIHHCIANNGWFNNQ